MQCDYFGLVVMSKIDWESVDWSKTNKQLAIELGKSYNTVAKHRYLLGRSGEAATREPKSK